MLIREIAAEPLEVRPDDLAAETRENTWSVSATQAHVAVEDVVAAVEHVGHAWDLHLAEKRPGHRMTFYVWTDHQAGQLRVSARSCEPSELPLGDDYDPTASLEAVARAFSAHKGLIPWGEMTEVPLDELDIDEPSQQEALPVWCRALGTSAT